MLSILKIIYTLFLFFHLYILYANFFNKKITFFLFFNILSAIYLYIGIFINFFTNQIVITNELFITLLLSLILSVFFLFLEGITHKSYSLADLTNTEKLTKVMTKVSILSLMMMLLYFIINGIPLFNSNVEYQRVIAFKNTKLLYYNILIFAPFILIYLFFFKSKLFFIIFSLLYFITCFLTGFRSLLISLFVILILVNQIKYNFINITNVVKFIKYIIPIIILLIYLTYLRIPKEERSLQNSISKLEYRIFFNNIDNVNNIYLYFKKNNNLYGETIIWDFPYFRKINILFNPKLPDETFAIWMTKRLNPYYNDNFIMTPTVYGISIANFGLFGILITNLFVFLFSIVVKLLKHNEISFPIYIYIVYLSFAIFARGFFSVIGLYLIPILMIYFVIVFLSKTKKFRI